MVPFLSGWGHRKGGSRGGEGSGGSSPKFGPPRPLVLFYYPPESVVFPLYSMGTFLIATYVFR